MQQSGYSFGGDYSGTRCCQDCGNQAKKECEYMRCRTCCRNRELPCKTHVKSTWVSAAKRRERQQQLSLSPQHDNASDDQQLSLMITTAPDGYRHQHHIHDSSSSLDDVPTTHFQNTSSSGFHFPAEVHSPALFQCVRVSGMDESREQLAYQTAVNVGGHVFNGILYDHGPDPAGQYDQPTRESASAQRRDVNLITSGTMAATGTITTLSTQDVDPFFMYPPRS